MTVTSDDGMTLVELVVAMAISSLVVVIAFAALGNTQRSDELSDEESQALTELRTATQRLVRELRQSGKVYQGTGMCGSNARQIEFWVDQDRDYSQDDEERIIWQLDAAARTLTRRTRNDALADPCASPTRVTHAEHLVVGDVFTYNSLPPDTTLIGMTFSVDIDPTGGAPRRTVRTTVRLRSAPDPDAA